MKITITLDVDTETGQYEAAFRNVSHPGTPIDMKALKELIAKVALHIASGKSKLTNPNPPKALLS